MGSRSDWETMRAAAAMLGMLGVPYEARVVSAHRTPDALFEYAAAAGLVSVGCRVTSLGIVTTPTVGVMVEALGADGGLVITASHNPIAWNGLKALRHDGCAPPASEARELIELFRRGAPAYVGVEAL